MKLYIVVNEWDAGVDDMTLREELYYTLDRAKAKADLDNQAGLFGIELGHDEISFHNTTSPVPGDYYYIEEAELDG